MPKKIFCVIFCFLFFIPLLVSQSMDDSSGDSDTSLEYAPLPMSFVGITLEDTKETVITKLKQDDLFVYRDDPDISFLPLSRNQILRVSGKNFLEQALFQFDKENKLVVMILSIRQLDYFTVYTTYQKKYGRAHKINPRRSQWSNDNVRIIIEKPLQIKFLLLNKTLKNESSAGVKYEKQKRENREQFLSLF